MNFDLKRPCVGCPFLKEGGVKHLGARRAREIAMNSATSSGGTFACHKTVRFDEDGNEIERRSQQHCAGALLFMEKVNEGATQFVRIAERLGIYNKDSYTGAELVFDTVEDMVAAHKI